MSYQVAIDGPAGAGKSTIARQVAKNKGFIYVDTGAMYRAMALHMIRSNVDIKDAEAIAKASETADISIQYVNGEQIVLLNGENVNGLIRTPQVSAMASVSSANPQVRARLLHLQQKLADENDVIMDGRDIGTFVLPNAELKIYLTASVDTRADRRYKELVEKHMPADLEEIKRDIEARDYQDMHREIAPLTQAEDAYYLDSSALTIDEVVAEIIRRIPQ